MLKVMIVDDDVNVRKCLRKLIPWDEVGCTIVAEASDGMEGLLRFHESSPDVVITDLKMPVMDGERLCEKIRSFSDKVSIIFLSAYENFSAAQNSLHYGVSEYILKPIDSGKIAQLTSILKDLSTTWQNSKLLHLLITDTAMREQFADQLRRKNVDYFDALFQNMSSYPNRDFLLVRATASVMLHLLLQQLSETTEDAAAIRLKYRNIFAQFDVLTRKMDITSFVSEHFSEYLKTDTGGGKDDFSYKLVEQIKSYVLEHINDPQLSVSSIADYFDFSDDYMGRMFKKHTDVSLVSYITHIRLNQACRLLKNTRFTIAEIAQLVGYSSSNYFCRVFKKQLNTTPNDFRNRP